MVKTYSRIILPRHLQYIDNHYPCRVNLPPLQVEVKVSKPGAKGDVPLGVIVGSAIGGLLLLALAVALLWKVLYLPFFSPTISIQCTSFSFKNQCVCLQLGFFKRKYQPLMKNDETAAEHQELQENSEAP